MKSNTETIWVTNVSGEQVVFSKEKLHNSLQKTGAGKEDIQQIIAEIEKKHCTQECGLKKPIKKHLRCYGKDPGQSPRGTN